MSGREQAAETEKTVVPGITKKAKYRIFILAVLIAGVLTGVVTTRMHAAAKEKLSNLQEHMAGEVLRFHVLANSDSEKDQALKMKVKEAVLAYMEYKMPQHTDLAQTREWVGEHLGELGDIAQAVICGESYDYPVHLELTTSYFPEKTYGDVTFPAGEYEALRIEIGEAKGHNWWCVLYPPLCFVDVSTGVLPDNSKEKLRDSLSDTQYHTVTKYNFKFKYLKFFNNLCQN